MKNQCKNIKVCKENHSQFYTIPGILPFNFCLNAQIFDEVMIILHLYFHRLFNIQQIFSMFLYRRHVLLFHSTIATDLILIHVFIKNSHLINVIYTYYLKSNGQEMSYNITVPCFTPSQLRPFPCSNHFYLNVQLFFWLSLFH